MRLPELAENIKRLGRVTYPDVSEEVKGSNILDCFTDAQPDDSMPLRIRKTALRPIYMVQLCRMRYFYDKFTT